MARISRTDWLETFVAFCDHGSFTLAARALHRSQSRVSAHVADLEKALGQSLVDRTHRPPELTHAGAEFLPHARAILAAIQGACDDVDRLTSQVRGRVMVGTHPSISAGWMPGLLVRLTQTHPHIRVTLIERTTADLVGMLTEGAVDLAVLARAPDARTPLLEAVPLWTEPYVAVVRADDATLPEGVPCAELVARPLIGISAASPTLEREFASWFEHFGLPMPALEWSTEQPQTAINLVREGLGVAIINNLAYRTAGHAGLAVRLASEPPYVRTVHLWHDTRRRLSAAATALADLIVHHPVPPGCEAVGSR